MAAYLLMGNRESRLPCTPMGGAPAQCVSVVDKVSRLLRIATTADRLKPRNLARDPRAALHVAADNFWAFAVAEGSTTVSDVAAHPNDEGDRTVGGLVPGRSSLSPMGLVVLPAPWPSPSGWRPPMSRSSDRSSSPLMKDSHRLKMPNLAPVPSGKRSRRSATRRDRLSAIGFKRRSGMAHGRNAWIEICHPPSTTPDCIVLKSSGREPVGTSGPTC
jgi:hypothetical protein